MKTEIKNTTNGSLIKFINAALTSEEGKKIKGGNIVIEDVQTV